MHTKDFFDSLEFCFHACRGRGGLLRSLRERAWNHFLELGLPDKSSEAFQYVPLREFYQTQFLYQKPVVADLDEFVHPECRDSYIVMVDGQFSSDLSRLEGLSKAIQVCSLEEAMRTYGGFLQSRWRQHLRKETDPFAVLNTALHDAAVFVYIPPRLQLDHPVQIIHIHSGGMAFPKVHLFAGRSTQVNLIWSPLQPGSGTSLTNSVIDIALEENSHVKFALPLFGPENRWHFDYTRASLKKESRLQMFALTRGSELVRSSVHATLIGEGAEVEVNGLALLSGAKESHVHVLVEHEAPGARSRQLFKTVAADQSRSSFEGNIIVRREAQKTEAYQLNHQLLLGEHALVQSKPRLEICADDVKASHGATVSAIDPDLAFYLKTRGIGANEAHALLIQGFCQEITSQLFTRTLQKL